MKKQYKRIIKVLDLKLTLSVRMNLKMIKNDNFNFRGNKSCTNGILRRNKV